MTAPEPDLIPLGDGGAVEVCDECDKYPQCCRVNDAGEVVGDSVCPYRQTLSCPRNCTT